MKQQDDEVRDTGISRKRPIPHIIIEAVTPTIDCGRYCVKRVVGESCVVEADIFRDGPAALAAVVKWRRENDSRLTETPMVYVDNDRWRANFHFLKTLATCSLSRLGRVLSSR